VSELNGMKPHELNLWTAQVILWLLTSIQCYWQRAVLETFSLTSKSNKKTEASTGTRIWPDHDRLPQPWK